MSSKNLLRVAVGDGTAAALSQLTSELGVSMQTLLRILIGEALNRRGITFGHIARRPRQRPHDHSIKGPGFVYLARNGDLHKIGLSIDPVRRMDEIAAELVHSIAVPNMLAAERFLHNWFQPSRVTGEWFNLSAEDVAWFVALEEVPV